MHSEYRDQRNIFARHPFKTAAVGVSALVGLGAVISAVEIVDEGSRGAVYTMGELTSNTESLLKPGLNFVVPFFQDARHERVNQQTMSQDSVITYTKDNQVITASLATYFVVPESRLVEILENNPDFEEKLRGTTYNAFKNALGREEAQNVAANRAEIMQRVTAETKANVEALLGITIVEVQMPNFDFDDDFEAAVSLAANEKAALSRKQTELEQQRVEKEKTIVNAEAAAQQVRLAADAEAYQITQLRNAEARGFENIANAIGQSNMGVYLTTQRWNGTVPQVSGGGGTILDMRQIAPAATQTPAPRPPGQ